MKKRLLFVLYFLLVSLVNIYPRGILDFEKLCKLPVSKLSVYGDEYMKKNQLDTAMRFYIVLANKYEADMILADKYLCAMACNAAGLIYVQKENYSKAFDFYLKGVSIAENNNFGYILAEFYKNIGNIYTVFSDFQQTVEYHKKGLAYARKYNNEPVEIKLLMNLAGICCYEGRTAEAKIYYDEMMNFVGKDRLIEYFGYLDKALILMNEKKFDLAISCFEKSAEYARCAQLDPRYIGSVYGELAKLYEQMGQKDSALHYFHRNAHYTEEHNLMYMFIENLKSLARLYEKNGNERKSLYYKSRYLSVSDSLFGMDKLNKIKNTQFFYEMDKSDQKITSLTVEKEHKEMQIKTQRRFLIVISAGLIIFIVLLVIVYIHKKRLHRAYKDIFSRNSEILQSDLQNRELRTEYENRLAEEKARYEKLEQQTRPFLMNQESHINTSPEKNEDVKLYSVNRLTDEQKENFIRDINNVMENTDEFCDCDFNLERLAVLIGSNSRYVSQIINETYNKNFRTFVNEYRIKEARRRLMNTDQYGNYTIKAIAESVGYKSHTSFIDIFKKTTGITPSIYQKLAKEER